MPLLLGNKRLHMKKGGGDFMEHLLVVNLCQLLQYCWFQTRMDSTNLTSSRKNRAEVKEQSILNFLDDDEKFELEGRSIGTSMQFDTFGFTAAELARKQADKEQQQRPSTIPGPIPDELIVPATESIGVKLLLKMGWRQGQSIKDASRNSLYDVRREARKSFLALSSEQAARSHLDEEDARNAQDLSTASDDQFFRSTPAYVLNPKQDLYGLGFDPFKQAPEFREKKKTANIWAEGYSW